MTDVLMEPLKCPPAAPAIRAVLAKALAPKKRVTVSQWADKERKLSSKGSAEPGDWRTDRNPPLREPMDNFSVSSPVHETVLKFPIQFGKTEVAVNVLGEAMCNQPGPIMVCLPGEVSMHKWVNQKLTPMLEETAAAAETLSSVASRDSSNTRTFKDFAGGQLYLEHAGSPARLKSTSVRLLITDEVDEFAANLTSGDDPLEMLDGRTSAFPGTYKRLDISTPGLAGVSRIEERWEKSDQRLYHVPCPHCGEMQPLEWEALKWSQHVHPEHGREVWLVCRENGCIINEHQKTDMVAAGRWVPGNPSSKIRGYHINCLYYPLGLGPRWHTLVEKWLDAQGDPAKLKTFFNDRLARVWAAASSRNIKANLLTERAEPYPLRQAPHGVLRVTVGVDTQDDRLAVQFVGWGRAMASWTLDYVELPGDPAQDAVWIALTELVNRPIQHACGALITVAAVVIDAGGHRTEAVKSYVRSKRVRRPLCIFGAVPNNAPVLSKGKPADVNWRGQYDKRGVLIYHVGTVAVKHALYARLAGDADAVNQWKAAAPAPGQDDERQPLQLMCHFSDQLPEEYFPGLISEVFNPSKNRYEKRRGAVRNEPLDTWVYAYSGTHHPELRLHRATRADWDRMERELLAQVPRETQAEPEASSEAPRQPEPAPAKVSRWHSYRKKR
jgi:phage terminase large subunit GpA-like protein